MKIDAIEKLQWKLMRLKKTRKQTKQNEIDACKWNISWNEDFNFGGSLANKLH